MLLASDGINIGEKWTTVLPFKIDGDFFYSVASGFCAPLLATHIPSLRFYEIACHKVLNLGGSI